ncbi:alpha/beta hydrolase [Streptomyces cocklensis]|uniref:Pimeloyl-ACP methyl ester carboxylesterase n=1 Tax=Actinacidiphila cocklensis TaxID=887465 RepID=A0A9W4DMR1_9ACTN|nr:alpha/beta fold hydrolase [Actinacidiphila cocklensis]MDD1059263.1 alpha/beta hydrolase [Actinacidiphila cocklensis]CAG6392463.1 Pimeloyl-ACP methyl ester carboxylesterase [Actinacidiphila cocklensis]
MQQTEFGPEGAYIRWTESEGVGPARVHVHGLGAASGPYTAHLSAYPELAGRRTLYVDLPGFGISDRPADFGYSLEDHASALAAVLDAAGVDGAEVVGHSMGGSVAIVLAYRRPDLVSRLVLAEANLDPVPAPGITSSGVAGWSEEEFVHGGGFAATLERVGWLWRSTMRLADPLALHRSACGLIRGTEPTMRAMLTGLGIPRTYLVGEVGDGIDDLDGLAAAGVRVVRVPDSGHCIMFDNPRAYAAAISAAA